MRAWIAAVLSLGLSGPSLAWGWLSAPQDQLLSDEEPEPAKAGGAAATALENSQCIHAILKAQRRYNIPENLLLALGLQEAGYRSPAGLTVWPWAVNAAGEGRHFATRAQAEAFVAQKLAAGVTSIDLGCLQINMRWHPNAFSHYSQGFEPDLNVEYAARYLRSLYEETGDWWQAAGYYHSRSAQYNTVYLASLAKNQQVVQAHFGDFTALSHSPISPREPVPYRSEGAIWGASMAGAEGERRSLYSAHDLEPVLPHFTAPEN